MGFVQPWAITVGPDSALWFADAKANVIGRIDPSTKVVTKYADSADAKTICARSASRADPPCEKQVKLEAILIGQH